MILLASQIRLLVPGVLLLLVGCSDDGSDTLGIIRTKPRSTTAQVSNGATPTPAPTPNATATPNAGTTVTSGISTSAPSAPVATMPPNILPSPTPTPVGAAGFMIPLANRPKSVAFLTNTVSPWVLRSTDLVALDGNEMPGVPYATNLSQPSLLAADGYFDLWVLSAGSDRLDHLSTLSGLSVVASFSTSANPVGLAVDASEAWVAHGDGTLIRITKASGGATTFNSLSGATAIALDPTNSTVAWVTGANNLYKINRSTGVVARSVPVGSSPVAVAVDANGTVWVANQADRTLSFLTTTGSGASTVALGMAPSTLVTTSSHVWVGSAASRQVAYLSLQGTLVGTSSLPIAPAGSAVDAYGRIWFADPNSNALQYVQGP